MGDSSKGIVGDCSRVSQAQDKEQEAHLCGHYGMFMQMGIINGRGQWKEGTMKGTMTTRSSF